MFIYNIRGQGLETLPYIETGGEIILPLLILIPFLLFILLWEGSYIFDVMLDGLKEWDFDIY